MTRIGSIVSLTAAVLAVAVTAAPAGAQVSDARLKELMRQAAELVDNPAPTFLPPQTAAATGQVVPITLEDAVKFALERNLDIAVQRQNPELQDIAIATARAAFNPSITTQVSRASQTNAPTNQLQLSQGGGGVRNDTFTYNGGYTQLFAKTGATFSAALNNSRQESTSNNVFFNPQFNSTWSFNLSQPLLRGFKIDAQRRTLEVARINRDISDVQLRATLTNTISNVRNAYWDFVFATQAVEVARQSLELAEKLVQDNQTRVEIGTMAPIDVVQAQAEQATRRQALVTAESTKRTTELALKRLIVNGTSDPNWAVTLDPIDRPEFRPEPVDVEAAVRRALSERTDVNIVKRNVEVNNLTLKFLRNATMPDVDLNVNYGTQGVGGPRLVRQQSGVLGSDVTTTVPGGLSDAFQSLFARENPRWTVGLNVTYPIGTSTQDAAVARARVQLNQVESQIKQIELQVATDITNAAIQLRNTAEAVEASQASRDLMQRRLEAEQSKFEVGMSTNYFVVQAQRDLNDARNSELRAILNFRKAQVEFERLQQTTLQNSNITLLQAGGGGGGAF
jgi:outer membrane protein